MSTDEVCANCGIAEVDDVKLEECDGCDLVKYCSNNCREQHREQHEEECKKQKEVHDKKIFSQPDGTHLGECPLCFLPMPIDPTKYGFWTCCSNSICYGCVVANCKSNKHDVAKAMRCPFCREPANHKESDKKLTKRAKANDPAALSRLEMLQRR